MFGYLEKPLHLSTTSAAVARSATLPESRHIIELSVTVVQTYSSSESRVLTPAAILQRRLLAALSGDIPDRSIR